MRPSTLMSVTRRVARNGRRRPAGLAALAASLILLGFPGAALANFSWSSAAGVDRDGGTLISVSCPSGSQCTTVDFAGQEVTFNPTNGDVIKTAAIDGREILRGGVSCPSTSQCTAVDADGNEITFNPVRGKVQG